MRKNQEIVTKEAEISVQTVLQNKDYWLKVQTGRLTAEDLSRLNKEVQRQKNKWITLRGDKLIYKGTLKKEKYLRCALCWKPNINHVRRAPGNRKDRPKQARRNNSTAKQQTAAAKQNFIINYKNIISGKETRRARMHLYSHSTTRPQIPSYGRAASNQSRAKMSVHHSYPSEPPRVTRGCPHKELHIDTCDLDRRRMVFFLTRHLLSVSVPWYSPIAGKHQHEPIPPASSPVQLSDMCYESSPASIQIKRKYPFLKFEKILPKSSQLSEINPI